MTKHEVSFQLVGGAETWFMFYLSCSITWATFSPLYWPTFTCVGDHHGWTLQACMLVQQAVEDLAGAAGHVHPLPSLVLAQCLEDKEIPGSLI